MTNGEDSVLPRLYRRLVDRVSGLWGGRSAAGSSPNVSYKSWWNEHAQSRDSAYSVVSQAQSEDRFRDEGERVAKTFLGLDLCDSRSRVLEIGCGTARIGRELAPHVASYTGVDISEGMIEYSRRRTERLQNVSFHALTDVSLGPFADESFDFVFSTIVLFHLDKEDLFEYLREAHRVLTPEGKAYFDTWNLESDWTLYRWLSDQSSHIGDAKALDRSRNQYATPTELRRYLLAAGFDQIEIREADLIHALCRKGKPVTRPKDENYPFVCGSLDRPLFNELVIDAEGYVEGWTADPAGVVRVEVIVDGRAIPAQWPTPRPDVAAAYPGLTGADRSGYYIALKELQLGSGWHTIKIIAHRSDGSAYCAGSRTFKTL